MFLQDDCVQGEETKALAYFLTHQARMHDYTLTPVPKMCTVLIKPEQVDRRPARAFLSSLTCSGQNVNEMMCGGTEGI